MPPRTLKSLCTSADREIMTTQRGKRIATSIEGTLTGLGGNLIIIDDPELWAKVGDGHEGLRRRSWGCSKPPTSPPKE
jgi:hypothetical protein